MSPRITVFIPVYQAERYLAESIDSILCQSYADFELLIIDDGSRDNSYEIAKDYATKDQRIRVLRNEGNQGVSFTRNRGIQEARGEFIALLDADDLAVPERLAKQLAFLDQNPDVVACGTQASLIDTNGKETGEMIAVPTHKEEVKVRLAFQNQFVNSSMMFRLEVLKQTRGYYSGLCEDYELAVQLNAQNCLANLADTLVKYRVHEQGISKQHIVKMREGERAVMALIQKQLGLEPNSRSINIHHCVLNEDLETIEVKKTVTLRDFEYLFLKLKEANRRKEIYSQEDFERLLFDLFYEKLRRSKSRTALWIFMTSDLYRWKWTTAKMFRKLFKQVFGIT